MAIAEMIAQQTEHAMRSTSVIPDLNDFMADSVVKSGAGNGCTGRNVSTTIAVKIVEITRLLRCGSLSEV